MIKKRLIHFIGIGGIGMSALARYYRSQGWQVSGSDSARSLITDSLLKEAIKVKIGHKTGNLPPNADLVVYNRAISTANPELVEADKLGLAILPYAEVLGEITKQYTTIAITGSHGKSTTTSMAGLTLTGGSLDPTVLVGTNLKEFGGKNIRIGKNPQDNKGVHGEKKSYLVLEADDYGAAFLAYSPFISIITNVDKEHMDFYKTFAGVKNAFLKFIATTRDGGVAILNQDDRTLYSLKARIAAIAKKKKLRTIWYSTKSSATKKAPKKLQAVMKIPGEHNLSNAMAVYELAKLLKIPEKIMFRSIGAFNGSWRRMEYRGKNLGVKIYDDYAHHPTEIKATLKAFKEKFVDSQLVCIFQPHQAKRLEALFKEFVSSFNDADALIFIPSYTVTGRDAKKSKFTSEYLAKAVIKKYPRKSVYYLGDPKRLKLVAKQIIRPNAVIIMMGAGDIVGYTDLLLK